jgi:2EXR family
MATQERNDVTVAVQQLLNKLTLEDPGTTFTLFPKLPTELRLKIFGAALPTGDKRRRFIQVKGRIGALSRRSKNEPCWFILEDNAGSSDVKNVALLGANKESRYVYLRHFTKSLRAKGKGLIRYHEDDTIFVCKYSLNYVASISSRRGLL